MKNKIISDNTDVVCVNKVSELIKELELLKKRHGDLELTVENSSEVWIGVDEYNEEKKVDIRTFMY